MTQTTDGIIIGAGISGLAMGLFAAFAGRSLPIYEAEREIKSSDHLLWIAPNGLVMLERLGVLNAVRSKAIDQDLMGFTDHKQRPLMSLWAKDLGPACGFPIIAVKRGDLWQILHQAFIDMGGVIHFAHRVKSLDDQQLAVKVEFHEQHSLATPFVIGADGIGSVIRRSVFPESTLDYQGLRTWLGHSPLDNAHRYLHRTLELWGVGTRFVMTSIDGHSVHWSALERAPKYRSHRDPIPENSLERLQSLFAGYHPDVREALQAAELPSLQPWNFSVVRGLKQTYRGRVVLLGDAAHGMPPNMGQGASLGMEDALALVHALTHSQHLSEAYLNYDKSRRRRVNEMRRLANSMNTLFQPKSAWASQLRNTIAALIPDQLTAYRMIALYQASLPR